MSFSVGICGLPNVGKSTLFKALTKREVKISPRPFTTIKPNFGQVSVPDERLEKIAGVIKPEKVTPTQIEFVDIAGLVKGAYKGEGLGNQFLGHIKNCDAILVVVRCFSDPEVENLLGEINPQEEIEVLKTELLMKDLESVEKAMAKLERKQKEVKVLEKLKDWLSRGKMISELDLGEEKELIKSYRFLTEKPIFYLLNVNGKTAFTPPKVNFLEMNLKEEEEISELSDQELKELGMRGKLEELILNCYKVLNLITFFTVAGGKEVKAWTLEKGKTAPEAGGVVHSDFQKKFIRAEVIDWQKLVEAGSWQKAKELGLIKIVGKDYQIEDGQVVEFKI
jgi:ribosome-binding ATPase YchF (GTP1/OBG family)